MDLKQHQSFLLHFLEGEEFLTLTVRLKIDGEDERRFDQSVDLHTKRPVKTKELKEGRVETCKVLQCVMTPIGHRWLSWDGLIHIASTFRCNFL